MMNQAVTAIVIAAGVAYLLSNEDQRSRYFPEKFFNHSFNQTHAKYVGIALIALGIYLNTLAQFQLIEIPFLSRRAQVSRTAPAAGPVGVTQAFSRSEGMDFDHLI